jgi:hypothetical protein
MRSRRRNFEVYSLSAIDLFASAMGAFIIITIILMPDYQKEVRSQGDLDYLEELAGKTQAILQETEEGSEAMLEAMLAAQTRHQDLQAEHEVVSSELETLDAEQQARNDQPPPPPPSPVVTPDKEGSNQVTFRFLGLKTDRKRILFLVDMNRYLSDIRTFSVVAFAVLGLVGLPQAVLAQDVPRPTDEQLRGDRRAEAIPGPTTAALLGSGSSRDISEESPSLAREVIDGAPEMRPCQRGGLS